MDMSSQPDLIADAVVFHRIYIARYLSIAGFAVLLYDIFLTFADEVQVIWSQKVTFPKLAYLINRYGACMTSALYLSFLIPQSAHTGTWYYLKFASILPNSALLIDLHRCTRAGISVQVLMIFTDTVGNGIILYELIRLWACKRKIAWIMASGYIIMHSCIIGSLASVIIQMRDDFHFLRFVVTEQTGLDVTVTSLCIAGNNPQAMKGVYIPAVTLDVYSFILLLINALSRPRSTSQRLLDMLWGDGLVFFLTTFSVRIFSLVLISTAPGEIAAMSLIFSSMVVAAAVSRLFLRMNETRNFACIPYDAYSAAGRDSFLSDTTEMQCRNVKTSSMDD